MPYEFDPGPIQAIGTFLYQLDTKQGGGAGQNLWGGSLNAHNGYDEEYLHKALKLFLAAEDMLKALQMLVCSPVISNPQEHGNRIRAAKAAITKATQP